MKNKAPIYQILLGTMALMLCLISVGTAHLYSKKEAFQVELNKKKLVEEFLLSSKLWYEKEALQVCQSYDNLVKENIALKARLDSKFGQNSYMMHVSK